jgi:hypothetical protein
MDEISKLVCLTEFMKHAVRADTLYVQVCLTLLFSVNLYARAFIPNHPNKLHLFQVISS